MGAVVEIWFESLIPFLLKDSHIVHSFNPPTSSKPYVALFCQGAGHPRGKAPNPGDGVQVAL